MGPPSPSSYGPRASFSDSVIRRSLDMGGDHSTTPGSSMGRHSISQYFQGEENAAEISPRTVD